MLPDNFDDDFDDDFDEKPEGEPIRECPFCGSACTTDNVCQIEEEEEIVEHFYVMCDVCSATGPVCDA